MSNEQGLLQQLNKNKKWPLRYMFKFITPNEEKIRAEVLKYFPKQSQIFYKKSKSDKYLGITCIAMMPSAESILEITKKISNIKGVVTL